MRINVTNTADVFAPAQVFTDWQEATVHIAMLPPCYVVASVKEDHVPFDESLTITYSGDSEKVLGAMRRHQEAIDHAADEPD